ncbi:tetratricopeptide repeat protein [Leadbettera azotonutricia]|uniref:Tetratricopeptide repeat protein n=1 Tax=Leadbettera azotonutricia (strain ATCC BAA-888 / DSM 13862 / ZAS-9) TaxID=545695 RepID=F5Y8B6_LEAAZ|nr:tetratricopeptide repeat protein [Leadbettera azotonutricia]AEF81017.1 tetratricopeptide repeat protein [Leadbettera azotonutricia ZAS-9]
MNRLKHALWVIFTGFCLFSGFSPVFSQTAFAKGEEFFMQNKPKEALGFLENAVAEDPAHVQAFIYLGIVYQQLGLQDEAIAALRKILPRGGQETAKIAYNLGNAYFAKNNMDSALQFYTQAIEANGSYSSAYLNRANAKIKANSLRDAIEDYQAYLVLEPQSAKRPQIEKLIAFIQDEFATEERRRIMAEEAARAEAERKKRLMDEVSASLQAAAEDSKGLSAGNEDVQGYDGEFEME